MQTRFYVERVSLLVHVEGKAFAEISQSRENKHKHQKMFMIKTINQGDFMEGSLMKDPSYVHREDFRFKGFYSLFTFQHLGCFVVVCAFTLWRTLSLFRYLCITKMPSTKVFMPCCYWLMANDCPSTGFLRNLETHSAEDYQFEKTERKINIKFGENPHQNVLLYL